jgi:hypothetical protein
MFGAKIGRREVQGNPKLALITIGVSLLFANNVQI